MNKPSDLRQANIFPTVYTATQTNNVKDSLKGLSFRIFCMIL